MQAMLTWIASILERIARALRGGGPGEEEK